MLYLLLLCSEALDNLQAQFGKALIDVAVAGKKTTGKNQTTYKKNTSLSAKEICFNFVFLCLFIFVSWLLGGVGLISNAC